MLEGCFLHPWLVRTAFHSLRRGREKGREHGWDGERVRAEPYVVSRTGRCCTWIRRWSRLGLLAHVELSYFSCSRARPWNTMILRGDARLRRQQHRGGLSRIDIDVSVWDGGGKFVCATVGTDSLCQKRFIVFRAQLCEWITLDWHLSCASFQSQPREHSDVLRVRCYHLVQQPFRQACFAGRT